MKLKIFLLMFSFFILFSILPAAVSQQIDIQAKGTCKEFDIIINAQLDGCWDAKIEAPAMVLHADGWKSSFFYVNNELCAPRTQTKLRIMLGTKDDITATLKLRQNDTIIEKDFAINQSCPIELTNEEFLLVVAAIIAILALGIAIYTKPKKFKRKIRRKR